MIKIDLALILDEFLSRYNDEKHLVYQDLPEWTPEKGGGYHTRLGGRVHSLFDTAKFINLVYFLGRKDCMEKAENAIWALLDTQDMDPSSRTYGLWAYYYEEDLSHMINPDFNWACFISNQLMYVLKRCPSLIDSATKEKMLKSLKAAAECVIKRNVSPDYTNISMMSAVTLVVSGEILEDNEIFAEGKRRFKKAYEYNSFCGSFSEYNSPTYTFLAIEELARMLLLADDEECIKWAEKLSEIGWKTLIEHYDEKREQLCPPHSRAYFDFMSDSRFPRLLYVASEGKFGYTGENKSCFDGLPARLSENMENLLSNLKTPRFVKDTFYKENSLRAEDEETVIVRDLDCPDLKANSYIDDKFSIGSFEKTDLWAQRRTNMVYWGEKDNVRSLRLRCLYDDTDFCSGMSFSAQHKNCILSACGFATDHGAFHYILDKEKNGILKTDKLFFCFEVAGNTESVHIERNGNSFVVSDGDIKVCIDILAALFDGKEMEIELFGNRIELICHNDGRTVDFSTLDDSYIVFTMTVNDSAPEATVTQSRESVIAKVINNEFELNLQIPKKPEKYLDLLKKSVINIGN